VRPRANRARRGRPTLPLACELPCFGDARTAGGGPPKGHGIGMLKLARPITPVATGVNRRSERRGQGQGPRLAQHLGPLPPIRPPLTPCPQGGQAGTVSSGSIWPSIPAAHQPLAFTAPIRFTSRRRPPAGRPRRGWAVDGACRMGTIRFSGVGIQEVRTRDPLSGQLSG